MSTDHALAAVQMLQCARVDAETFDQLTHLNVAAADLAKATADAVYQARHELMTWTQIGMALGMSKQAAQQKYGREALADWNVTLPTI
jgi:hypothetical protein